MEHHLTAEQLLVMPDEDFVMLSPENLRSSLTKDALNRLSRKQLKEISRKLALHPHTIRVREARKQDRQMIKKLKGMSEPECMCTIL